MFNATQVFGGLTVAFLLIGCAGGHRDDGFAQVEQTIADRLGQRVHWNQGTAADAEAATAVEALLDEELTADAAVQVALLNNRRLQAIYEDLGIAQADLVQAGLLRNPVFHAEVLFPVNTGGRTQLELSVTQEFLSVVHLPLRRRVAAAAFEGAKLRVGDAVLDHSARVRRAFFNLQAAQQHLEMMQTVVQGTEAQLEAADLMHRAGNIPYIDLLRHRALHERNRLELADAQAAAMEHREHLSALMGIWGEQGRWRIGRRLPELPQDEPDLTDLELLAVAQRLDLAATRQEVEMLSEALGVARARAIISELELGVAAERKRDGDWLVGPAIGLPIPIFDTGRARQARAGAQLRQSWQRQYALTVEIGSEVRRLRQRMLAAREQVEHYRSVVLPLHGELLDQALLHYNAMDIGLFQLLETQRGQIDAGRRYIQALRDYWLARSELERAVGGRLPLEAAMEAAPLPHEIDPVEPHDHEHHDH